jgi:hypothetical protein
MQLIVDVGMTPEEYVACRGHEIILAPERCPNARCGNNRRLHRHMKYERGLSGLPTTFCVAVFWCQQCRTAVSCLPSFALPYRYVRVATVEAFLRGETEDPEVQRQEHFLRRYWKDLQAQLVLLLRRLGCFLGKAPFFTVKEFWRVLRKKCADLANGSRLLVMNFGLGLFRQYAVHAWARESICGVGSPKRRVRVDSS